jgi:hypothetical protein
LFFSEAAYQVDIGGGMDGGGRWKLILAASALLAAVPAYAQQPGEAGGIVVGIAVDSIYGAPLRGAIIRVAETGASATTDSAGRFRITGVPRGRHRVEVIHPLLDTLRLALRTVPREFGDSTEVVLATPSTTTVAALKCTAEDRSIGSAVALGFVTVAGTEEPVAGATVRIEWTDYEVQGKRLITNERSNTAVTGEDGSYRMCGIPQELETGIFAVHGADTTTALRRNFSARLAIASFRVSPARPAASDQPVPSAITAEISGRVVDTLGRGVEGARIASEDGRNVALSRADGTFELAGIPAGSRGINVRKLGFHPVSQPVDVPPGGARDVEVQLSVYVPVLETVRITAQRNISLERVGFASRRRSGVGSYLGPDEIERRNPYRLNDLLRTMPGLRTYYGSSGEPVVTGRRGECLRYYLDGNRWFENGDTPDRFITGREVGAVELYSAMTAPPQFVGLSRDGSPCTVVVIWTKWKLRL